jgi:copper chaperone CopZ
VNEAIKKNLQVEDVQSFHKENRTEILSQAPLDEAALKAAIDSTGYKLMGITVE